MDAQISRRLGPLAPGVGDTAPAGRASSSHSAGSPADARNAVAFRALLERLEQRATEFREQALAAGDPGELAGALDYARASLDDAMSLSERLLEAYRASVQGESARESAPGNVENRRQLGDALP